MTTQPTRPRRLLNALAVDYALFLIGLSLIHLIWPQRAGVLALTQIFAPYLFLPLLVLGLPAWPRGPRAVRITLLACALVFVLRFPPHLSALTARQGEGLTFTAMSWNVEYGGRQDAIRAALLAASADIVTLQETHTAWIEQDNALTQRYPYRHLLPSWWENAVGGMALLSRYPIRQQGALDQGSHAWPWPPLVWAWLDLGQGRMLRVFVAHPQPPSLAHGPCLSGVCYDPARRDAQLRAIHGIVNASVLGGESVLLLGDLNVTDREPAYQDLTTGLVDAYRAVGTGTGHTWGLEETMQHGWPLLRIDYLFTSRNITPHRLAVDCTPRGSDHCILLGTFTRNEE